MAKFEIKTNWVAITGAPSSGKTSVIEVLAKRGFHTEKETAREVIETGLNNGKTLAEIRQHNDKLQHDILLSKIDLEKKLNPAEIVFLDRGIPDSITYFRLNHLDMAPIDRVLYRWQYKAVFIFDPLPFVKDHIRTEDEELALKMDVMFEQDYIACGYTPVRVPVMAIEQRADFILEKLGLDTRLSATP